MKTVVPFEEMHSELTRWQGAEAVVWMYHATHRRLAIMLSRPGEPEVLYVVAVGCAHIHGPFRWQDASLTIAEPDRKDEHGTTARVEDKRAAFEIRCSSVALALGPATDYDATFEGFLDENP